MRELTAGPTPPAATGVLQPCARGTSPNASCTSCFPVPDYSGRLRLDGCGRLGPATSRRTARQQSLSPRPGPCRRRASSSTHTASGVTTTRLRIGGLALDVSGLSNVGPSADVWEKVVRKLHMGAMPPPGSPRPEKAAVDAFLASLETALDNAAARSPNPGRTETLHRLNRAEYQNAIRDLLALDIDTASLLPADDAEGFDNVASLLSISPALMERYLSTARRVSRLALGLPPAGPLTDTYTVADLALQDDQISEDLPFGTRGGLAIHHYFPVDAEYLIKVRLRRQIYDYVTGLDREEQLDIRVDGVRVKTFTIGGGDHGRTAPQSFGGDVLGSPEWEKYALTADDGLEIRLPVTAGPHIVGVTFTGKFTVAEGVVQPRERYGEYSRDETRNQAIDSVAITGPYNGRGSGGIRHTEPPQNPRVPAQRQRERGVLRQEDSVDARASRLSAARVGSGGPDPARFLQGRPPRGQLRRGHPVRAGTNPRGSQFPLPGRTGSARRRARTRPIASATSSWPPVCRSSSGAACPTMSCSTWRSAGS